MKFRRFSAFFLVGFFVVLSAILLSSKPALSDWTNDLEPPTGTVQVQCPGKVPQPLSTTATTTIACAIDVSIIPGCQDTLSGCWKLSYGIDSPAAPNNTELTDCSSVVNTVDMSPPHPTLKPDGTTHTVTLKDVYDCAGNHTIKTSQFSFYVCDPTICTSATPPPTNTPTPTATPVTNTPTATPTNPVVTLPPNWFQGVGGDMRQDWGKGFIDNIPTPSPSLYASRESLVAPLWSQSPGVIYSGATPNFGGGEASVKGWLVTNSPYALGRNTSYATLNNLLINKLGMPQANITSGGNCNDAISGCDLGSILKTPGQVYMASGHIYLTTMPATVSTIPSGSYVILADDITIIGNIPLSPGVFLLIASKKDIIVNGSVTRMVGFYSADQQFTISATAAPQLVIEGFAAANAAGGPYFFENQRPLTVSTTPSVLLVERPDLILSTPEYLRKPNYIWQEVTP